MSEDFETIVAPLELCAGVLLPTARLVFKRYGTLNAARDNAIVFPTRFGATHRENEFLIGPGRALDSERYCIIVPNLFGNGLSSSPSNTAPPYDGPRFPAITIRDAVRMQHHLLHDILGIRKLALAVGWSMGGQQAYEWACAYPHMVRRLAVVCGAARTAEHNKVFLKSLRTALIADAAWNEGYYTDPPLAGLRAVGRIYAAWAYSQDWFHNGLHLQIGSYGNLDGYLAGYWDRLFEARDANNLLSMIATWIDHDISANDVYRGDLARALSAIEATTLLIPASTDLYFRTADNERERLHMRDAQLLEIPTVWGHMAGSGQSANDSHFIDSALRRLLNVGAAIDH
jgi:homoserine O-acetyltransferase